MSQSPYPPYNPNQNNGQYQQQQSPQQWQGQGQGQPYAMQGSQPYAQQQAPMPQGGNKWEGQYSQDYGQKTQKLDEIKPKCVDCCHV